MMRKLFLLLFKKYIRTEEDRLEVFKALNERIKEEYNEQTEFGNVYNSNIEFIMSNKFICKLVHEKDGESLKIIKRGLASSIDEAIDFIENEKINKV